MIREERLFSKDIMNIFTDASMTNYNGISCGCSGAICVVGSQIIDKSVQIINNTTNNFTELYAIILGIDLALKHRDLYKPLFINLYSDSKICIYGIKEWIFKWIQDAKYNRNTGQYTFINSSGKQVANQELFIYIVNIILENNLQINFYHQNGHITNSQMSLNRAKDTFVKDNSIVNTLEYNLVKRISQYNNFIDNHTREYLKNNLSVNNPSRMFFNPIYTCNDMQEYINLLNL